MTTFIVLGALVLIGPQAAATVIRTVHGTVSTVNAVHQLDTSYTTLSNSLGAWEQATTDCDKQLACVTRQDGTAAGAFDTFSAQLAGVSVPSGAAAGKARLSADAALAARDFTQLSKTTTDSQYQATVSSTGLQQTLDRFDQDFNALGTALDNS